MTSLAPHPGSGARASDQASRLRALVEACAQIRPAEQPQPAQRSARVLTVASGKGGVGKTNIAVNLAIALTQQKLRVTLLDADLGVANADVLCGLHPGARLDRVWAGGTRDAEAPVSIDDIAVRAPGGFRLVPGIAGMLRDRDLTQVGRDRLLEALEELDRTSDVIVVDASPGVGPTVTGMLGAADLGLVVTTPEPTAIADAYALIKCVTLGQRKLTGPAGSTESTVVSGGGVPGGADSAQLSLLINNARDRIQAQAARDRLAGVCEKFLGLKLHCAGWIAHDEHVPAAVFARHPFLLRSPRCTASRDLLRLSGFVAQALIRRDLGGNSEQKAGGPRRWFPRFWG